MLFKEEYTEKKKALPSNSISNYKSKKSVDIDKNEIID